MLSWGKVPWSYGPFIEYVVGPTGAHHTIRPNNSVGVYSTKQTNMNEDIPSPVKMNIGGNRRLTKRRFRR